MERRSEQILLLAVLFSGLIQGAFVIGQALGLMKPFNAWFMCTGSFRNPAHAACIVTCALAVLTWALIDGRVRKVGGKRGLGVAAALMAFLSVSLMLCCSRACILSYATVTMVCLMSRNKTDKESAGEGCKFNRKCYLADESASEALFGDKQPLKLKGII